MSPPKRSLGQNFLVDVMLADRFVAELGVGAQAQVVEIGPGRGALTKRLLMVLGDEGRLRLVEKDDVLAAQWQERAKRDPRIEVIHGDALQVDVLSDGPWLVLGNLPYNIAGRIAMRLLESRDGAGKARVLRMVLGFQREVAERFSARPGQKAYNAVSVLASSLSHNRPLFDLPPEAYRPRPKVHSRTVQFAPRPQAFVGPQDWEDFAALVHKAFTHRRKTLARGLGILFGDQVRPWLEQAGIDPKARPQELGPEDFVRLFRCQPTPRSSS